MNMQATSINLRCFDGVSIWRALEKSRTFVSRYFRCSIWRTPLTVFPATCQTGRRIIISFCILCFHQLQTLRWQNCVRETERPKGNWQTGQYLTTNKSSMRTSSNDCMRVMQRQRVEGLRSVKLVMAETLTLTVWSSVLTKFNNLSVLSIEPFWSFCTEPLKRLTFQSPVPGKQQSEYTEKYLVLLCS